MKPRLASVSLLYLAQALPLYFCTFALPTILRAEGLSLERIGLSALVLMPWVIKFLWAPLVDKHYWQSLGRRRSWFLPLQCLTPALLLFFALLNPIDSWWLILVLSLLLSMVSATQDIAVDGYTMEQLEQAKHRFANLARVAGTTLGSFLGGALLIACYDSLGWTLSIYLIAALCFLIIFPMYFIKEKPLLKTVASQRPSLLTFWRRQSSRRLLAICLIYRACEGLVMGMQQPFLVDLSLSLTTIGLVMGIGSASLGLLGATAASFLLKPLGSEKALFILGGLRTTCYLALATVAMSSNVAPEIIFTIVLVNMATRLMEMVVLYTIFMQYCSSDQPGTDFTVLVCAELFIYLASMSASGFLATHLGYGWLFFLGGLLSIPSTVGAVYFLYRLNNHHQTDQERLALS